MLPVAVITPSDANCVAVSILPPAMLAAVIMLPTADKFTPAITLPVADTNPPVLMLPPVILPVATMV